MASLIAGTGAGGGVQGLAPAATILPIRMQQASDGLNFDFEAEERRAEAITYAVETGAQVISLSAGRS